MNMMLTLIAALGVMLASWLLLWSGRERVSKILTLLWLALLLLWLNTEANLLKLGRNEEGLLGWIGLGLLLLIGAQLSRLWPASRPWSRSLIALAALSYAQALDVFHPDAYGYFPATIIALMVLAVVLRVLQRIRRADGANLLATVPLVLPPALMLYASFYKLFDRNWVLPWSYLMAAGAILFVLAQLWQAWVDLGLADAPWRKRIAIAFGLSQLLIVVSGFYHYSRYF